MPKFTDPKMARLSAFGLVLVAIVFGSTIVIASASRDDPVEPALVKPSFEVGLPIDTPPAHESTVLTSPAPGHEDEWAAVVYWAATACGFDGNAPASDPAVVYKTTAGEVRRRVAAEAPEYSGVLLGSGWSNDAEMFIVAFRGEFHHRPAPPITDPDTKRDMEDGGGVVANEPDTCLYYGNGRPDPSDNGSVGITHFGNKELTIETLFMP
jgi:hypothetical protein